MGFGPFCGGNCGKKIAKFFVNGLLLLIYISELVQKYLSITEQLLICLGLWPKMLSYSLLSRTSQPICADNKLKNNFIDITLVSIDSNPKPPKQTI